MSRLLEAGIQFNQYAHTLFKHPAFSPSETASSARLVQVSLADLKMQSPCSLEAILTKASHFGLKPCPLSLAAFLRLEYLDQPEGPYLTIASLPPENDETYPTGFYIRNFENTLWLRGYRVDGEPEWPSSNEFIFQRMGLE